MPELRRLRMLGALVAWLVMGFASGALAAGAPAPATTRPNIVMLYSDDVGYGDFRLLRRHESLHAQYRSPCGSRAASSPTRTPPPRPARRAAIRC